MPLRIPRIDDRTSQEFLQEALARVRVHNPEWTNLNPSDPGVTILELFAFMAESLLYRANLIPERNRLKFLSLLQIPIRPAVPAHGLITLANDQGPLSVRALPAGMAVQAASVPFRTQQGLDLLPVEHQVYYKELVPAEEMDRYRRQAGLPAQQPVRFYRTRRLDPPAAPDQIPSVDLTADAADHALWIALLAREGDQPDDVRVTLGGHTVNIGCLPALTVEGLAAPHLPDWPILSEPGADLAGAPDLLFEISTGQAEAPWRALEVLRGADILASPGVLSLRLPLARAIGVPPAGGQGADLPPVVEDDAVAERLVAWVRIRMRRQESGARCKLGWVGINAVAVVQAERVDLELAGTGTGEPGQVFALQYQGILAGSVQVTVGDQTWMETRDLLTAGPEVAAPDRWAPGARPSGAANAHVFTVDAAAGLIQFGDGMRGARPPAGAPVVVSYEHGGGRQGNVGIGAIDQMDQAPPFVTVTNPVPTWGGADAQTVEEAEQGASLYLRHQDRLVTEQDFHDLVLATPGVAMGRVEVLPLHHPTFGPYLPGCVTVLAIPAGDPDTYPEPDRTFLDRVREQIEPRRLVTTEIHIVPPAYQPFQVTVGIDCRPDRDFGPVREAVEKALRRFVSPLAGGWEQRGWPLGQAVEAGALAAEAARVDGVASVLGLRLSSPDGHMLERLPLGALELPRLVQLSVGAGPPEEPGQIPPAPDQPPILPVPVVPENC